MCKIMYFFIRHRESTDTLKYPQRSHFIKTNWPLNLQIFFSHTTIKSCCSQKKKEKKQEENKFERDFSFF